MRPIALIKEHPSYAAHREMLNQVELLLKMTRTTSSFSLSEVCDILNEIWAVHLNFSPIEKAPSKLVPKNNVSFNYGMSSKISILILLK